jgi:hypothetical protein
MTNCGVGRWRVAGGGRPIPVEIESGTFYFSSLATLGMAIALVATSSGYRGTQPPLALFALIF